MASLSDAYADLRRQAEEQLEGGTSPAEWGPAVALSEHEEFVGGYVGQKSDPSSDGRPAYLLLDESGERCFVRGDVVLLDKRMAKAAPNPGDRILIIRGEDATGRNGSYHTYAVAVEPWTEPELVAAAPEEPQPCESLGPAEPLPF